ncbi:MAG: ABC transporter permease [Planctomycetes bacterium]|nr:ABC transporter permease [Planctomycetota bacterium]
MSGPAAAAAPAHAPSRIRDRRLRALLRNRAALAGALLLLLLVVAALGADLLAGHDPLAQALDRRLEGPSAEYPLGTDDLGRDVLARLLHGARYSLLIGGISVGIAVAVGVPLGAVAGYAGGRVDALVMRVTDVMLAFPSIVLAIAIVAALGASLPNLMIAVGVVAVPGYARQVRASVLLVKAEDYVRTVMPNCIAPLIVLATLDYGAAILEAAALSFLGLGPEVGTPEWGKMLAEAQNLFSLAPRVVIAPGLCISAAVLAFNLMGDGLRDALDPRAR